MPSYPEKVIADFCVSTKKLYAALLAKIWEQNASFKIRLDGTYTKDVHRDIDELRGPLVITNGNHS